MAYSKENIRKRIIEVISYLFILLFIYAAVSKLIDVQQFRVQLGQSPMLSAYAHAIAWLVPLSEIAVSVILMIPKLRFWGFVAAFDLMLMFTTYIIIILNFTAFIPCSCGGVLESLGWTEHLIFNLLFILLAAYAALITPPPHQLKSLKILTLKL
ncbi:MAG: MauE/DoxX family redox-associated membrane protein [Bacteroidota bacterium]